MGIGQVLGFAGATVVLVGMPGPNNLYISLRSLTQGRRAGVVSAFAIETGTLVYIVVTALGLATLVQASPTLFAAITVAGALYLAYLGVKALRASTGELNAVAPAPLGRVFRDGVVVNLLNPKAALFFLASPSPRVGETRGWAKSAGRWGWWMGEVRGWASWWGWAPLGCG